MAASYDYDLVVIGSGPGGYVSAIRATQLGMTAAVIEKDKPGGVCLNVGCIPSKALIHQAEIFRHGADLEAMGVKVDRSGFDYSKVFKKSRTAAQRLSKGVQALLKKNNIELIEGTARLSGEHEVTVDGKKTVSGRFILVATGSRPKTVPGFEFDEDRVISSTGALMLEKLPEKLLILGAGYIGMEFAHVMSAFGVDVTVVEMLDQILPNSDGEAVAVLHREFKRRGIKMLTGMKASNMKKTKSDVSLDAEDRDGNTTTLSADLLLVAVGRSPNTEDIGLEELGIELEKGFVKTGDYYRTSAGSVYAIGDIVASPQLAHVAMKEGEIAVEHMAGHAGERLLPPEHIPGAIYTEPQLASFGPTEESLKADGVSYGTATFPYRGAGKAVAIEQPEGLVKVLFNTETHEILAAHVAGSQATELIHELLLGKRGELLPHDIATMVHAHPTLSEAVMEAARGVEGWIIHA
ncbi:MAG: dihydrolipoyl dehydrogenase [Spirochaetaceae bacterium]